MPPGERVPLGRERGAGPRCPDRIETSGTRCAERAMSMRRSRGLRTAVVLVAVVGLVGLATWGNGALAADVTLQGTGATFPAPLYQRWFTEYNKLHPEVQINYQALGSGAGVKQFQEGLVNFGASDAAMTDEEIAAVKDGVVLLPMTAGSVVLAYNLPG